ncbi:MAG: hypothetical protein AAF360_03400 [Pseudomonadota bacterium]
MGYIHVLPIAKPPCCACARAAASLSIQTEAQYGVLIPARTVVRRAGRDERYLIGGTVGSRYGWIVSMAGSRLFKDVRLVFRWTIKDEAKIHRCDHHVSLELENPDGLTRPLWTMDDGLQSATAKTGSYPTAASPVSLFPAEDAIDLSSRHATVKVVDGCCRIDERLRVPAIEFPSSAPRSSGE